MHLLPQLGVRSSAADLSVKSRHKNMFVQVLHDRCNHLDLKYLQVLYRYSVGLKIEQPADYIYCISVESGTAVTSRLCQNAFADLCCNIPPVRGS